MLIGQASNSYHGSKQTLHCKPREGGWRGGGGKSFHIDASSSSSAAVTRRRNNNHNNKSWCSTSETWHGAARTIYVCVFDALCYSTQVRLPLLSIMAFISVSLFSHSHSLSRSLCESRSASQCFRTAIETNPSGWDAGMVLAIEIQQKVLWSSASNLSCASCEEDIVIRMIICSIYKESLQGCSLSGSLQNFSRNYPSSWLQTITL